MINKKKTAVFSAVFFVFLFAISIIPAKAVGTPVLNSNGQTSSSLENKADTISTGSTSGMFASSDDIKYYIVDVTPGIWNITIERDNVSLDADLYYQEIQYSLFLEENYTSWNYYDDLDFIGDIGWFAHEDDFPQGIAITSNGHLMIQVYPTTGFSHVYLADSWHYQINISHQAPIAISSGNVNIELAINQANSYAFSVANSGLYNLTYVSNVSDDYHTFVYSERGDKYTEFDLFGTRMHMFYLETGISYYYFVYSEDESGGYFDGDPLGLNISLRQMTFDETITSNDLTIVDFAPGEFMKVVLWQGSPEGLYQISADTSSLDVELGLISLSDDQYFGVDDDGGFGEENMSLFLRPLLQDNWWQPIGEDDSHLDTFISYSTTFGSWSYTSARSYNLWTNEYVVIVLYNWGGSGLVALSVDQVPVDTISFNSPTMVNINESSSATAFKVLQFESKINYEYNIVLTPDVDSHVGGLAIAPSWYVGTMASSPYLSNIVTSVETNYTMYAEVPGGEPGSTNAITGYLILGVEAGLNDWGDITVLVDEMSPSEISVGDDVTKSFTKTDSFAIYKIELNKDKTYTIEMEVSQDSFGFASIDLSNEKRQMPDISGPDIPPTESCGGLSIPETIMTLASHSDQTLYLYTTGDIGVTLTFTVSEVDQGFAIGGYALYLLIAAIPLALLIGLVAQKKKEII